MFINDGHVLRQKTINEGEYLVFDSTFAHAGGRNNTLQDLFRLHFYVCKRRDEIPADTVYSAFGNDGSSLT